MFKVIYFVSYIYHMFNMLINEIRIILYFNADLMNTYRNNN